MPHHSPAQGRSWALPALLLGALLLAALVGHGRPSALDLVLEPTLATGPTPWSEVTQLGTGPVLYPLLIALSLLRLRERRDRPLWWVLLPVLALAAGQVLEGVLFVGVTRAATAGLPASSFSSGHTAAATLGWGLLTAGLLSYARPQVSGQRAPGAVGAAVGLVVGASRVELGAHWASDVLAAVALGLVLLAGALALDGQARPRPRPLAQELTGRAARLSTPLWWLVPAAAALLPVALLLATPGLERLKDLLVYQGAGGVAGAGHDVYGFRTMFGMPFTYPPFAALLSEPLSRMPIGLGQLLWTAATLAATVPLARVALAPVVARVGLPLTVAALLLSSPMRSHLRFGQVGVFLVLAVAVDLLRPGGAVRGLGLGLATAVKLTPAVFLPWLLLVGARARLRASVLWLAAGSCLGLLLLRRSSIDYLGAASHDTSRFGANDVPGNQSVRGMLLRSGLPDALVQPGWLTLSVLLVVAGTWGACRLEREGRRLAAVGVLAALSVAVSPISWVHHLVWLVLPIAALVEAGRLRLAVLWWLLLVPGLPALGGGRDPLGWQLVTDLQGLTAVAAVLLLPALVTRPEVTSLAGERV